MGARRKIFHKRFARVSPVFAAAWKACAADLSLKNTRTKPSYLRQPVRTGFRQAVSTLLSVGLGRDGLSVRLESLEFCLACAAFLGCASLLLLVVSVTANTNMKRQAASAQFARAEE